MSLKTAFPLTNESLPFGEFFHKLTFVSEFQYDLADSIPSPTPTYPAVSGRLGFQKVLPDPHQRGDNGQREARE